MKPNSGHTFCVHFDKLVCSPNLKSTRHGHTSGAGAVLPQSNILKNDFCLSDIINYPSRKSSQSDLDLSKSPYHKYSPFVHTWHSFLYKNRNRESIPQVFSQSLMFREKRIFDKWSSLEEVSLTVMGPTVQQ